MADKNVVLASCLTPRLIQLYVLALCCWGPCVKNGFALYTKELEISQAGSLWDHSPCQGCCSYLSFPVKAQALSPLHKACWVHMLAVDPEMHIRVCVYVNVCARLLVCLRAGGLLSRWSVVVYSGLQWFSGLHEGQWYSSNLGLTAGDAQG